MELGKSGEKSSKRWHTWSAVSRMFFLSVKFWGDFFPLLKNLFYTNHLFRQGPDHERHVSAIWADLRLDTLIDRFYDVCRVESNRHIWKKFCKNYWKIMRGKLHHFNRINEFQRKLTDKRILTNYIYVTKLANKRIYTNYSKINEI